MGLMLGLVIDFAVVFVSDVARDFGAGLAAGFIAREIVGGGVTRRESVHAVWVPAASGAIKNLDF